MNHHYSEQVRFMTSYYKLIAIYARLRRDINHFYDSWLCDLTIKNFKNKNISTQL